MNSLLLIPCPPLTHCPDPGSHYTVDPVVARAVAPWMIGKHVVGLDASAGPASGLQTGINVGLMLFVVAGAVGVGYLYKHVK